MKPKFGPFPLNLSSPVKGRPKVFWSHGSNKNIIVELWPPGHEDRLKQKGSIQSFGFGPPSMMVAYEKQKPHIRAIYFLKSSKSSRLPDFRGGHLEFEGVVKRVDLQASLRLFDEILKVQFRGRPRKDQVVKEANNLRKKGMTWAKIAFTLKSQQKYDGDGEAIRRLLGSRKRPTARKPPS